MSFLFSFQRSLTLPEACLTIVSISTRFVNYFFEFFWSFFSDLYLSILYASFIALLKSISFRYPYLVLCYITTLFPLLASLILLVWMGKWSLYFFLIYSVFYFFGSLILQLPYFVKTNKKDSQPQTIFLSFSYLFETIQTIWILIHTLNPFSHPNFINGIWCFCSASFI